MTPDDIASMPCAEWLEEAIKTIVALRPQSCAMVGRAEDGTVFTGYFNADATEKGIFCQNIQNDITLEIIGLNEGPIRQMWQERETEEGDVDA